MIKVKSIADYINKIAPFSTQCDWDNCGILIGDPDKEVSKIVFALDLTKETLEIAIEFCADLIITHHPSIFKPQSRFLKGTLTYDLALSGISAISAHTCFDCADGGVNDVLCDILSITDTEGVPHAECKLPMARIGNIEPVSGADFAGIVAEKLNTVCRAAVSDKVITRVAVCGGAGMDFFDEALSMGAEAFVTGDASHHHFLTASEKGVTLIAAGHFETEVPSMIRLMDMVANSFSEVECILINQTNPVKFFG